MFSKNLLDAMNEQMKNEFLSAYLYLAMAGYFEAEDLPGIASWMRVQALEELTHGEKFFHFICEAGGRTELRAIDAPQNGYDSPLSCFEYSLKHENFVTAGINNAFGKRTNIRDVWAEFGHQRKRGGLANRRDDACRTVQICAEGDAAFFNIRA